MFDEAGECPVASGVFAECQLDEWCSFGVELHPSRFSSLFVAALFVEVAQWYPADGAAVFSLLAHAFDDLVG